MTPIRNDVLKMILDERARQDKKWGKQNHPNEWWLAILIEEIGELAQAILHDTFGGRTEGTAMVELVHVVAVGIQWLECIHRRLS